MCRIAKRVLFSLSRSEIGLYDCGRLEVLLSLGSTVILASLQLSGMVSFVMISLSLFIMHIVALLGSSLSISNVMLDGPGDL